MPRTAGKKRTRPQSSKRNGTVHKHPTALTKPPKVKQSRAAVIKKAADKPKATVPPYAQLVQRFDELLDEAEALGASVCQELLDEMVQRIDAKRDEVFTDADDTLMEDMERDVHLGKFAGDDEPDDDFANDEDLDEE